MADSVTRYRPTIARDPDFGASYAAMEDCFYGDWCRYSDVALILERREALLREAADAIEDAATAWPQPNKLDALAARIREEIGE